MRFLVRVRPGTTGRDEFLETVKSLARQVASDARNPKWTSYRALEIDVFTRGESDFQLFLATIEPLGTVEFAKDLNRAPSYLSMEETFREAKSLFNSERYWECHEVLEGVWRGLQGEEKSFLQGVILVCAGFVHHQKGEDAVGFGVLSRAIKQLGSQRHDYHGIDVGAFRNAVERILTSRRFENFRI